MNQGKLEVVKQEMARMTIDIVGINELKWTGMGEFNSDDHYIYYCAQESLRRNGVAIMVNKRVWNAVLGRNLKNDRMISVRFQGKPFNITVIQVYALTSNTEEAEFEQFYDDLQDLLELTYKKDVLFIIGDWKAKVGSQEIPGVTGKFGLGVQNEAGQSLTEFCWENAQVIANTSSNNTKDNTWTSPDGQHRNQIDYIICSQRWRSSRQSAKTRPGADCGSDHELLIAKFKLKLKKVGKTTKPFAAAKSHQSCPTLCDPIDSSPPGSPIPGILQARILEWVAISFSNAWKWKVKVKSLSRVRLLMTPWTAAYRALPSMGFSRQEYWSGLPLPSLTKPFRYDLHQIPYDYTMGVRNRFKVLDLRDTVHEELWTEVRDIVQEAVIKPNLKKKKCKKAKWLSEENLK